MADVLQTLHHDHEKVEQLFEKLKQTGDGAEKTRKKTLEQLKHELKAHTQFEEELFYPAVRAEGGRAEKEVKAAIEEHHQVDRMLQEIEAMDVASPEFLEKIEALEQAVKKHVKREEGEIFRAATKAIDEEESAEMNERHDKIAREHQSRAAE